MRCHYCNKYRVDSVWKSLENYYDFQGGLEMSGKVWIFCCLVSLITKQGKSGWLPSSEIPENPEKPWKWKMIPEKP